MKKHSTAKAQTDARRISRLKELISQWGGPTALAKKLGHSGPSYLSQLASGKRSISEKVAREIEEAAGLPVGWFDVDEGDRPPPPKP